MIETQLIEIQELIKKTANIVCICSLRHLFLAFVRKENGKRKKSKTKTNKSSTFKTKYIKSNQSIYGCIVAYDSPFCPIY